MGVPKFMSFLRGKEYPGVLLDNPPAVVSTLSLDLNGIFHAAAQEVYAYGDRADPIRARLVEKADPQFLKVELFNMIGDMMLNVITTISPKDALIIAIDGLAPLAKMQQQRQRRYKAAMEKTSGSIFDSNSITPGTAFMNDLSNYLERWIYANIMRFPSKIVYSSHMVPGEGEHKIFDLIRDSMNNQEAFRDPNAKELPLYDNRKVHIIYGLDADLIMLSLISPLANIQLMREDVRDIVHIGNLRRAISYELKSKTAVEDFVLMMYFLGNDFLPHHPGFEDMVDSLDKLFEAYRSFGKSLSHDAENGKSINFIHMAEFLSKVAEIEPHLMSEVANKDFVYPSRMIEGSTNVSHTAEGKVRTLDFNKFRSLWYLNALGFRGKDDFINEIFQKFDIPKEFQVINPDEVVRMCEQYLVSLEWIFQYYQHGSSGVSDKYLYPFFHCPLIKDLADVSRQIGSNWDPKDIRPNTIGVWKFNILHQILIVIPPKSKSIVPQEILPLYENDSFIIDSLPEKFILEKDGKNKPYQFLALVPFVDPYRIITAVDTLNIQPELLVKFIPEEAKFINAAEIGGKYDEQANLRQRINQVIHRSSGRFQRGPPPQGKILGEQKFGIPERRGRGRGIPRGRGRGIPRRPTEREYRPAVERTEREYKPIEKREYKPVERPVEKREYKPIERQKEYKPIERSEKREYKPVERPEKREYKPIERPASRQQPTVPSRGRGTFRGRGRGRPEVKQDWASLKVLL